MYLVVGFGNPLLDIIVKIPDDKLFEKYKLHVKDQKEISDIEMANLYEDLLQ